MRRGRPPRRVVPPQSSLQVLLQGDGVVVIRVVRTVDERHFAAAGRSDNGLPDLGPRVHSRSTRKRVPSRFETGSYARFRAIMRLHWKAVQGDCRGAALSARSASMLV